MCRVLVLSILCFQTGVYDAAVAYRSRNIPQIIIAGQNYGIGASRDWAAKGLVALVSYYFHFICAYVYVYMYMCMCLCLCLCVYGRANARLHVHASVRMFSCGKCMVLL